MAKPSSFPWPALVEAIRSIRPAVRVKWSGDDESPPWEPWMIVSSISYLETGRMGPVPFDEVEWVEINPHLKNELGRLVAADQTGKLCEVLGKANIPFQLDRDVFRINAKT